MQAECIPQAVLGLDVICQAKSGMGKTAVFVIATLQQIAPVDGEIHCVVLANVRELAFQIQREYHRLAKYMPHVKSKVFYGGVKIQADIDALKAEVPHIVVGTPGRILDLATVRNVMDLSKVKFFVLDECDKLLEEVDMRKTVQTIFKATPVEKQVMMFSATLSAEARVTCRRFCQNPLEILIDDESKLKLHGLTQFYSKLDENQKNRKLTELLDSIDFNQVIIFVSKMNRARELSKLLGDCMFPSICIHSGLKQEERIERFTAFKENKERLLVTTDLFGRGIDIADVNVVINYDFPADSDQYLHRVGRAGRGNTKGVAVSFVSTDADQEIFDQVQARFAVAVPPLPEKLDVSAYM